MAKTINKKLEYKIDARIADGLYKIKDQLKNSKTYTWQSKKVAGLALLGEKDGLVDDFVPMLSNKGCWDSPEIGYAQFYKAFEKMINNDRRVVGMSIIKPEKYDDKIVNDIKRNIWGWRKTFADISQTILIVVSDDNIVPYRPYKDSYGRINIRKSSAKIWENKEESVIMKMAEGAELVKKLYSFEDREKIRVIMSRVSKNIRLGGSEKILKKNVQILTKEIDKLREPILERKMVEKKQRKEVKENMDARIEAQKIVQEKRSEYITPIGDGMILVKTSDGKEILWQESQRT